MTTDLALYASNPSALATEDAGKRIEQACQQAVEWLKSGVDIPLEAVVETRAQAAAIATFTVQKRLGKDAENAALEVQRRAERGIGLAVRRAQEAGEIRGQGSRSDTGKGSALPLAHEAAGFKRDALVPIYAVTDNVTDEQFDQAVEDAKAEGDLSRATVIRKVGKQWGRAENRTVLSDNDVHRHAHTCRRCVAFHEAHHRCTSCGANTEDRKALIRRLLEEGRSAAWIVDQGESRADVTEVLRQMNRERQVSA